MPYAHLLLLFQLGSNIVLLLPLQEVPLFLLSRFGHSLGLHVYASPVICQSLLLFLAPLICAAFLLSFSCSSRPAQYERGVAPELSGRARAEGNWEDINTTQSFKVDIDYKVPSL